MKEKTTQSLLAIIALLLLAHLVRPTTFSTPAQATTEQVPAVLRAQAIELVNKQGQAVAQLFLGEDGSGNLRLRDASGTVRAKLGASAQGAGLLLMDKDVEPALWLLSNESGTSLTLAEKGKAKKVFKP